MSARRTTPVTRPSPVTTGRLRRSWCRKSSAACDSESSTSTATGPRVMCSATVELTHRVAGTEELLRGLLGSSARTAALLRALGAVARRRTRVALERMVAPYRTSDGALELPVAAKLASGGKR